MQYITPHEVKPSPQLWVHAWSARWTQHSTVSGKPNLEGQQCAFSRLLLLAAFLVGCPHLIQRSSHLLHLLLSSFIILQKPALECTALAAPRLEMYSCINIINMPGMHRLQDTFMNACSLYPYCRLALRYDEREHAVGSWCSGILTRNQSQEDCIPASWMNCTLRVHA